MSPSRPTGRRRCTPTTRSRWASCPGRGERMLQELEGKAAVVTGAASGIGRALADVLTGEGMSVMLADVEEGRLGRAGDELSATGAEVATCVTDVGDASSVA